MPSPPPAANTGRVREIGLDVEPEIAAVFDTQETQTVTLTNNDSVPIDVGSISLGGRHPDAFAIGSDDCSDGLLDPGSSCMVAVRYTLSGPQTDTHGLLKIPNGDGLAPDMTVSLFKDGDLVLPEMCVEDISPGSVSGSWTTDCVAVSRAPIFNARFYTFALEAERTVNITVDSEESPQAIIYYSEDVGGSWHDSPNWVAYSRGDSGRIENLALRRGAYTIEVTTLAPWTAGDFVLTLEIET